MKINQSICLVTGGSSGVGKAIAMGLAERGGTIILAGRSPEKLTKVQNLLINQTGNHQIETMPVDLSVQEDIRKFATQFRQKYNRLDLLSNNAGLVLPKREMTPDGIEKTWAVNFLSHFMLTGLLLDLLKASAPSPILTVAGNAKVLQKTHLHMKDLQFEQQYSGVQAALQSALAKVIFTIKLAEKLEGTGVTANTFHPGLIKSDLPRHFPVYLRFLAHLAQPFLNNTCPTAIHALTRPEFEQTSGQFFSHKHQQALQLQGYSPQIAEQLWNIAEDMTGVKY